MEIANERPGHSLDSTTQSLHQSRGAIEKFIEKEELNELEEQGLIQAFEYTYELAWNTLKDYFESQAETDLHGSRDVFRLAFKRDLIKDGETWMDMIKSRTLTSHTYNEEVAKQIVTAIINQYVSEFVTLETTMKSLRDKIA